MSNSSKQASTASEPPVDTAASDRATPQPNMLAFLLPLLVFMFLAGMSPKFQGEETAPDAAINYLFLVIAQVMIAVGFVVYFWRTYSTHFPFTVDYWGVSVGIVGVVLWIGICSLNLEQTIAAPLGLSSYLPDRAGFNPFEYFPDFWQRTIFLFFRFLLLAAMVPIIEELFLRGWFVRFVEDPDWHLVSLAKVGWRGVLAAAVYGIATHPSEAVAAFVWFSLVSWLMIKTGKFWNCVVAHAVTNLLLGLYVIGFSQWQLW